MTLVLRPARRLTRALAKASSGVTVSSPRHGLQQPRIAVVPEGNNFGRQPLQRFRPLFAAIFALTGFTSGE